MIEKGRQREVKDRESVENRKHKKEGRARLKQGGGGEGMYRMVK